MTAPTGVITVVQNIAVDLIFGAVIRHNTDGDKAKMAGRAQEVEAIATGVQQMFVGTDIAGGLNTVTAALNTSHLTPDESAALQNLLNFVGLQGKAIAEVASDSALWQLAASRISSITTEIQKLCNSFIPAAPVTPVVTA